LFDDLSPRFIGNSNRKVVFASNRPTDSLRVRGDFKSIRNNLGIFEHPGVPRSPQAPRLLDSLGTYNLPVLSTENDLYFLSDLKGVTNLYRYNYNNKNITQNSNLIHGLKNPVISKGGSGGLAYVKLEKGEGRIVYHKNFTPGSMAETPSFRKGMPGNTSLNPAPALEKQTAEVKTDSVPEKQEEVVTTPQTLVLRPGEVDTDNYVFDEDVIQTIGSSSTSRISGGRVPIATPRIRKRESISVNGPFPYKGLFIANDAKSEWAWDAIRGFGYRQSVSMNDLLEDNVIKAGGFLSMGQGFFKTYDLFLEYNLNKYRLDYGIRYDRSNLYVTPASNSPQKYRFNQ